MSRNHEKPDLPLGPVPANWSAVELGAVAEKIRSGATPKGGQAAYLPQREEFVLIRSQNVFDHYFSIEGLANISAKQASELAGATVESGDVLLNITGDGITFGRSCLVPDEVLPACVNQHVMLIRPRMDRIDGRFLATYLGLPQVKGYIESFNAGGSRRAITKGHVESFIIPLPPMSEQKAIGDIAQIFLDRITLLRETNATLEAIAQALFKSWFVDFDPVRAKAEGREPEGVPPELVDLFPDELIESELGMIPKGWGIDRVGEILELAYGKALKATDRLPGSIPVYGSGGITGHHNDYMVEGPGIVVGRKGTVGSLYWEDKPFFPIDTVFFVRPKRVPLTVCYYMLSRLGLTDMNTDAAVPGLNRENVYRLLVVTPPRQLAVAFDEFISPSRKRMTANLGVIDTLAELRDTLLPRLMSGKLRITEAEKELEAV